MPTLSAADPSSSATRPSALGLALGNAALAAVYVLLGLVSLKLATVGNVSPIFLPIGVAFGVVTVFGPWFLPGVAVGAFATVLLTDAGVAPALGIAAGNTLAPALGAVLARRLVEHPRELVYSVTGIAGLVFGCAYGASQVSAAIGTAVLRLSGLLPAEIQGTAWLTWWLGDALGIVIIAPVILAWAYREPTRGGLLRSVELAGVSTVVLVLTWFAFGDIDVGLPNYYLQLYAITPFMIWLALRFPLVIVAIINLAIAAIVIQLTITGHGIHIAVDPKERVEAVHGFLVITSFGILALTSTITQRARSQRVLSESEARFKALAALSSDWYWELDAELRLARVDGRDTLLIGIPVEERIGKRPWEMPFDATDQPPWIEHRRRIEARQPFYDFLVRNRDRRGEWHYGRLSGEPAYDGWGRFVGYRGVGKDVTREMRMQEALRQSEARFRSLTEMSSDWYWEADAEFRFVRVDGPGLGRSGIHPRAIEGKRPWEIPDVEADDAVWDGQRALVRAHKPFRDLLLPRRPNGGRMRYAVISGEPVFADGGEFVGYRGVGKDVTAEVEAREALRISEKRLRTLIEATPDLIVMKDERGRWIVANQAMLHISGLTHVDWFGRTDEELAQLSETGHVLPSECPCNSIETLALKGVCRGDETLRTRDGNERTFDFVGTALHGPNGEVLGAILLGREITHLKRSERIQQQQLEVIRNLNEELETRVQARTVALETANRELEAFSYSVSHDLRGPLRALNGFSRLLEEDYGDKLDAEAQHYLERIRRASERMGELIDDLLKLSRVSRSQVKRVPVDLSALVGEILDELCAADPERKVERVVQPGLAAFADVGLVRVLLDNLVRNAWKFTRRTAAPRIEFGRIIRRGRPYYFVRDNGAGFMMEHALRLFAPFQRLHHAAEFEGSGIGLAIVQRIARLHGGEVEAEGKPNAGATFYFTLDFAVRPPLPGEAEAGGKG